MRRRQVLILILALAGTISLRADEVVPKQLEFSRYDAMLKQSPFAVATAPMPAASAPSWSKDLFVANAAHTREVDLVTIMSLSDKNMKEYLSTEGPNKAGYAIANIQWSDSPGETKVTISRNGQFATLGFNEALMEQPQAGIPVRRRWLIPSPFTTWPLNRFRQSRHRRLRINAGLSVIRHQVGVTPPNRFLPWGMRRRQCLLRASNNSSGTRFVRYGDRRRA